MSDLRVNNLKARTDGNVPTIVGGAVISGITTITGVLEAESGITAENVSASGIATISTAIVGTAVTINSSGVDAGAGIITATTFSGNATGLTGTPDVTVGNVNAGIITATTFVGVPAGFTELDAALFN
jgi:hypothetical protein